MKTRTTLTLNDDLLKKAKQKGLNISAILNQALHKKLYDNTQVYRELVHHRTELSKRYEVLKETEVIKKEFKEFEKFATQIMAKCNNDDDIKIILKQLFKRVFGLYPKLSMINFYHIKNGGKKK